MATIPLEEMRQMRAKVLPIFLVLLVIFVFVSPALAAPRPPYPRPINTAAVDAGKVVFCGGDTIYLNGVVQGISQVISEKIIFVSPCRTGSVFLVVKEPGLKSEVAIFFSLH
jgi:hypothetical protein